MDKRPRESFNTYVSFFLLDQKPSETPGPGHILHLSSYRRKLGVSGWATDPVLSGGVCHYWRIPLFFQQDGVDRKLTLLHRKERMGFRDKHRGVWETRQSARSLPRSLAKGGTDKGGFLSHTLTGFTQAFAHYDQAVIHSLLQVFQGLIVGRIVHHQDTDMVVAIIAVLPQLRGPECPPGLEEQ